MKPAADALLFLVWVSAFLAVVWRIARYRHARAKRVFGGYTYRASEDIPLQLAMLLAATALGLGVYLVSRLVASLL